MSIQPAEVATDPYIDWLQKKNVPLFAGGGILWRLYQDCLVPASLKPQPLRLEEGDAQDLLRRSGAPLLRYFTATYQRPTTFWYTACSSYDPHHLSSETRRQIRRGHERCRVCRIGPEWLASNGYACYVAAFERYENARPESEADFRKRCLDSVGGPFEYWGVFIGSGLVGFTKCVLGADYVACIVLKLDPAYLVARTTYALKDIVLTKYVAEQGKTAYDGFRAIAHQTNAHDFFLRFGYRRVFCDLQVCYRPAVAALVSALYPLRPALRSAEGFSLARRAEILLRQEQIRRSFAGGGASSLAATDN